MQLTPHNFSNLQHLHSHVSPAVAEKAEYYDGSKAAVVLEILQVLFQFLARSPHAIRHD